MTSTTILSPVFERTEQDTRRAKVHIKYDRAVRLAMLSNSKATTCEPLFRGAEQVLRGRYGLGPILHVAKESFAKPMQEATKALLVREADVIVTAIGD